jgi:hypothetical protein
MICYCRAPVLLKIRCAGCRKRKHRKPSNFYKVGSGVLTQLLRRKLTALKGQNIVLNKERTANKCNICANKGFRILTLEEFISFINSRS